MTTGPGDDVAAGRGHLRASDADREQVIEVLKAAFAHGGLVKDEFEARIGQTFGSRTYAELADVTAGLARAQSVRKPARAQVGKAAACCAFGIVLPALFAVAVVPGPVTVRAAVTTTVVIYLLFWVCGASMMLASRPPKRSRRPLPPG